MKIAIGCDPNAQAAKEEVIAYIARRDHEDTSGRKEQYGETRRTAREFS